MTTLELSAGMTHSEQQSRIATLLGETRAMISLAEKMTEHHPETDREILALMGRPGEFLQEATALADASDDYDTDLYTQILFLKSHLYGMQNLSRLPDIGIGTDIDVPGLVGLAQHVATQIEERFSRINGGTAG